MKKKYDCYIASGWFNEAQAQDLENIKKVLTELKLTFFSPKDECKIDSSASIEKRNEVFNLNLTSINDCTILISNPRDKDMGTVFETGYAYANSIPILYYHDQPKRFNLMLSQSGVAVSTSPEDLKGVLKELFFNNSSYTRPYTGDIE